MALELIQLANYNRPVIKETTSTGYILNGDKHQFYYDMIDAYFGSPTNSAIIDSYSSFIFGRGLKHDKPEVLAKIISMISESDLRNVCKDFALFREASIEVVYKNGVPVKMMHVPKQRIASGKANDDGDIKEYFYSYDFRNVNKYKPVPIPAWGFGEGNDRHEIMVIRDYQVGQFYYSTPPWTSAIAWAKLEEEVSNFAVNHIQNGLSFGHIFNIVGANESDEDKEFKSKQIKEKLTSSENAGRVFVNFIDSKDDEMTAIPLEINNPSDQWGNLTTEAKQQLMTAHRLTSPLLVGVKDASGFSSNADELQTSFDELMIHVINPMQGIILSHLTLVFSKAGISGNVYIEPLKGSEKKESVYNGAQISSALEVMTAVKDGIMTQAQAVVFMVNFLGIEKITAEELFSVSPQPTPVQMSAESNFLIDLGETVGDDYEEIDCIAVSGDEYHISDITLNLAKTFSSTVRVGSEQDTELFKIRYRYAGATEGQRDFCNKMLKADKVYRYEDIQLASTKVVNAGFGPEGADTYDIWKYKGGVNCNHFWQRVIYLRKNNQSISVNEARKMILSLDPKDRPLAKWQENDPIVAQPAQKSNNWFKLRR